MLNLQAMWSKKILAKLGAVQVDLQGIKFVNLENLSTIVKTELNLSEVGK